MASSILCETYYNEVQKIWYGPKKKDYYNAEMTLGEAIITVLKKDPQKIIQIMDTTKEQLTCEELLKNSIKMCQKLIKLGLQIGDVVGLYASNTHYLTTVILATWLSGAAINAVHEEELEVIYSVTKPKIIFCDIENVENAYHVNKNLNLNAKIFVMNGDFPNVANVKELLEEYAEEELENMGFPCFKIDGDHTAAIACSSGTTGPPKGVLLSHKSLLNQNVFQTLQYTSVAFSFSPMFWVTALWIFKESVLQGCLRIITNQTFTPEYFMELMAHYQITHVFASVNYMTQISLKNKPEWGKNLKSINTIICGGSKVPQMVCDRINKLLEDNKQRPGFVVAYGMTELNSLLCMNYSLLGKGLNGSEGKLLPNTQVRIVSNDEVALLANQHGEIQLKFHHKWLGYFNNQQAFKKVYQENWYSTGDIGYFNDQGFLHICARQSDIFKSNNMQIYPERIEDIIRNIPGVQEVCVFGIPDLISTNVPACVLVRAANVDGDNVQEDLVHEIVREKLSELYYLKGGVYFWDSLPRTGSNKIKRSKIRDIIINQNNGNDV